MQNQFLANSYQYQLILEFLIEAAVIEAAGDKRGPANKGLPALWLLLDAYQDALFEVLPELMLC